MSFEEYNRESSKSLIYPNDFTTPMYLALGVNGESGELGEKVKKVYRDNGGIFNDKHREEIKKEIGDVLWYLNQLSENLGFTLESASELNLIKIQDRMKRDLIRGTGDNR